MTRTTMRDHDCPSRPNLGDDHGATMVEYSLVLAFVAFVAILAVTAFGINVNGLFDSVDLLDALS